MKRILWQDKKRLFLLWLLAAALMAELVLYNFSAWRSLFYRDRKVFEGVVEGAEETVPGSGEYLVGEESFTVHVPEVGGKLHNLFFALDFSGSEPVYYTVTLTDEGNYYPYSLPEQVLMPGIRKSYYTSLHPAGAVGEISVQFRAPAGSLVRVNGISGNAPIPFVFHVGRFAVILGVLLLIYALNSTYPEGMESGQTADHGDKRRRAVTVLVMAALIGMAWKLARINPMCVDSPWPHHRQYHELAEAMAEGRVYLDTEPSEGLLQAENPYDTIFLQANDISYRADYAYFEGKYYVYFGVVPELLLYLPCYLVTGRHLPNYMAVFLFYSGFILAVFALFREVVRQWFPGIPYRIYLAVSTLTVCCGNYLFIIARPDLYDTPIMAANMFTVAGLWLWIKGKHQISHKRRSACYLGGSLSMALVAGCRPQMLLFSLLAIPLFWKEVMKERKLFGKKGIGDTLCLCLPYGAVALGIMYYNQARFGSPLDFGAAYSLTSNDMTKRSFNFHQTLLGLWHFFLQPPAVSSDFPFLNGIQIGSASYMGKLNAEYTYGGMLACNAFLWVLLRLNRGRESLKKKGIWGIVLMSAAVSLLLAIVDVTGAGILQRYMVDMIWGVWLAAALLLFSLAEDACGEEGRRRVMAAITGICLLQAAYGFGVVLGSGDLGVNVRLANPELYYGIKTLFRG